MSHPTLGRPPRDMRAGHPDAALRLRAERGRIGARALEIAVEIDPSIAVRHGELGLRKLLRDTEPLIERLAIALAADDRMAVAAYADWVVVPYRRRGVPMDDLAHLCEGLARATPTILSPLEQARAEDALEQAARVFRWHRRLAGDARRRNKLLAFLYKGA